MKGKKRWMGILAAATAGMVLLGVVLAVWLNRGAGNLTLKQIAYDNSRENSVVYIKENGEYIPYLVLTSDYGGNVLLLRENLLSEPMQYKPAPHGEGFGALSGGWAGEYGSYYEESDIDAFLNTDFLEVFSPEVQAAIVDTMIEVTDMDRYKEWNYATHMIRRKVFLLSSVELGVVYSIETMEAKEGDPLKYFKNKEHSVRTAHMADGEAWPYWTRTPWLWETCLVTVIGVEVVGDATADGCIGVRPAFCMARDTVILESESVVAGKTVYVLKMEAE